jgi:hypothetical protein
MSPEGWSDHVDLENYWSILWNITSSRQTIEHTTFAAFVALCLAPVRTLTGAVHMLTTSAITLISNIVMRNDCGYCTDGARTQVTTKA